MKAKYSHKESKGLPGGPNEVFSYVTGLFSTDGYRSDSPDVNNPFNIIRSGNITMKERDGTPLRKGPLLGIDNLGNEQMMYPGMNYQFPGNEVTEIPIAQNGEETEPNMVHRDANWAAKVRAGLPIDYANYNDDQIRELYENQNIVGAEPYGDEMIASYQLPELEILPGRQHELPYYKDLPEHTKQIIRESNIPTPPEVIAEYGYDPWSSKHNPMLRSALQTASDGPFNLYDRLAIPAMVMEGVNQADRIYRVPQALAVEAYEARQGNPYDFSNVNPFTESNKSNMRAPSDIMEGGKQLDEYGQEELSWSGLAADVLADPFIIGGVNRMATRGIKGLTNKLKSQIGKKGYTNASKNAKFFDDFERNVDDVFNKGPEATWYDDVATTADDALRVTKSSDNLLPMSTTKQKSSLSKGIDASEARTREGSLSTLIEGKRDVALINKKDIRKLPKGYTYMKNEGDIIAYKNTPSNKKLVEELRDLDGSWDSPADVHRRRGEILGYNKESLDLYENRNYIDGKVKPVETLQEIQALEQKHNVPWGKLDDEYASAKKLGNNEELVRDVEKLNQKQYDDVKAIDVPETNSKSSGEFSWDDYRLNLVESQFPDQKIISMPDDALEVYMQAHDIKEPLPVLKHNTNYINNIKNWERKEWSDKQVKKYRDDSEKAFQEGVDLVDTWAYKDKAGYDKAVKAKDDLLNEVDALDIKFIDNESSEVSKFKDLLRKQLGKENEGMYKEKIESNPYLRTEDGIKRQWTTDRERARQIIIDSRKDGVNDPDVVKGAKIYYDKITKVKDLKLAASKINLHEFIDPDFKEKAEVLAALNNPISNKIFNPNKWDKPNQLETDIIPDTRDRSKLVQVDENDPSFKNLSEYDKNYLRENKDGIGGVRTSNSTITIGGRTKKNKFLALPTQKVKVETLPLSLKDPSTWKNVLNRKVLVDQPITEKDAQVIELIEDVFEKHDGIREIAAHEGGHDLQKYLDWLNGVTRYAPEFKYKINRAHQDSSPEDPINQLLNETMVEPTLPPKGGGHTTETWLSGFGELHSEMMAARTKMAYIWMEEGLSLDEAVKGIKQLEREGDDELFKWYFRKEAGNLGKHFKEDASWDKIKQTLMYVPAIGGIIAGVSAKEEMKDGGEYEEIELTPFEITELRARGHRVDVM